MATGSRIKLDCRAYGNPAPWVEWFKNGKLLRNKQGRYRIRTMKWNNSSQGTTSRRGAGGRQPAAVSRVSRLEVELRSGRNETGIYECRAMNVAAREPVVGGYTLLVLPEQQFALIPMQQSAGSAAATLAPEATAQLVPINDKTSAKSEPQVQQQRGEWTPTSKSAPSTIASEQQQQVGSATSAAPTLASAATSQAGHSSSSLGATTSSAQQSSAAPDSRAEASGEEATATRATSATTTLPPTSGNKFEQKQQTNGSSGKSSPVVVGQPCPREANENFCLNKGTCVLIGHIEEYFCK